MPHQRLRHILPLLTKRLKLWPVVGLLGARQAGKSTLLREFLAKSLKAAYVTLDDKEMRDRAQKRPGYFLREFTGAHTIFDEVQKAPDLFDAIKAEVDARRVPGRFVLSGSTEFSRKTGIRESLTGRIGILRLYPLTFAETESLPFVHPWVTGKPNLASDRLAKVGKRVERGGMPGICFLRDAEEREASFSAWLDTTCYRDLQQVHGAKLNGDLAFQILEVLAKAESPTVAHVAAVLKQDARRITSHILALEALFVLMSVPAHVSGVGKTQYFVFDSGLAKHLGASETQCYKIWLLCEILSQYGSLGQAVKIYGYRSSRRSVVDFVITDKSGDRGVIVSDEESPSTYVFRTAHAFLKKNPQAKTWILAPVKTAHRESAKIQIFPMYSFA